MWSPEFEKMFTSDFAEKDAEEIALSGKKAEEVEVLLNIEYSHGRAQDVTLSCNWIILHKETKIKETTG